MKHIIHLIQTWLLVSLSISVSISQFLQAYSTLTLGESLESCPTKLKVVYSKFRVGRFHYNLHIKIKDGLSRSLKAQLVADFAHLVFYRRFAMQFAVCGRQRALSKKFGYTIPYFLFLISLAELKSAKQLA